MNEIVSLNIALLPPRKSTISEIGQIGEDLALNFLIGRGLRVVCRNFKVAIGRNSKGVAVSGEIDLVMTDGDYLVFVEVKTRTSTEFATPESSVTKRKQRQISRTARIYRRLMKLRGVPYRFDVVAVVLDESGDPRIEHSKSFWIEANLRKPSRDDNYGVRLRR